ncbi:MAG: hypothetical protein Q8920_09720 [Bacillota bacterium]|nr:hypothetical protein [Bacillota bacterium]
MTLVNPGKGRALIENSAESIKITIPAKKKIFTIVVLSLWLLVWLAAEVGVTSQLIFQGPGIEVAFFIFWLVLWTAGGVLALLILLWNLCGKEIIETKGDIFKIERRILRFSISREYLIKDMNNFRFRSSGTNLFSVRAGLEFWGFGAGNIVFDYGMKTIRFAQSIDEAEVNFLIKTIIEFINK